MPHTPGPWCSATQNDALYVIAGDSPAKNNDYPRHDADREVIAKVYDSPSGLDNSRLLAAAPQLLEALKFVTQRCALYAPADRAREMAAEAIAKAQGR
jgi:hypothetical protein